MTTAEKNVILIQGAAGQLGLALTETLAKAPPKNCKIRAGYIPTKEQALEKMKAHGCECVKLDLFDKSSVENALKNVSGTVLIPPYVDNREEICNKYIDQCVANGVHCVVLISVQGSNSQAFEWAKQQFNIEQKLMSSGLKFVILRSALFQESFHMQKQAIKEGSLFLPTGDNKFAPVCFKDVAELVQKLLSDPNLVDNKTYEVTGPNLLNGTEIARIYTEILGKQVNFVSLSHTDYKAKMKQYYPQHDKKIEDIADLLNWYAKGYGNRVMIDYVSVIGKDLHTFRDYVQAYKQDFTA